MDNVAIAILAHPDDAEFLCAGTLIRLRSEHNWQIHIVSMTPGDCGSAELPAEEISKIRRAEGARAAGIIGATYWCLEERDLTVCYTPLTVEKVTRLLRQTRPRVVFTHSPADYMLDHEMTSTCVRAAAFGAPIPNFCAGQGHAPVLPHIPHLYYCDALEGKDLMGNAVVPHFAIDITNTIKIKEDMLAAHASQRDWLLKHHGMDHYLQSMRDWGKHRGQQHGVAYAEGFRQHRGHSYPQDNLLGQILGELHART